MKNKAHDASSYPFQPGEPILIDANIWLYLQPPATQPTTSRSATYSRVFANLLHARALPVVDALVLSEYLNRYIRLEYNAAWKGAYPQFKSFRKSADGALILQSAVAEIEQILNSASAHDTQLSGIDIHTVLGQVQIGTMDFNDGLLIENCRVNGWKLLTNDSDMTTGGIEVLTKNRSLLQACP